MTNEGEATSALNLGIGQQQEFIEFYNKLPEKPPTTVRFFRRFDYFTVHGEDTTLASQQNLNVIKHMGLDPKLSYLVLNRNNFDRFVRELLLIKQYRVEVYMKLDQTESNWELKYKGSPGNLAQFDEILFENAEIVFNSTVLAVNIVHKKLLAISCVNTIENEIYASEITSEDPYGVLEAVIAQISPRECLVPKSESFEIQNLDKVLQRNGILIAKVKKIDFVAKDIQQDLDRLLHFPESELRNSLTKPETNLNEAMGCLQSIIKYLHLCGDEKNFNQFKINTFDYNRFVRLDWAAIQALNLLPTDETAQSNKYSTVFGVLNKCCTLQGKRLLEHWIRQPLKDLNQIIERQEIVEMFVKNSELRQILSTNYLIRIPDLLILSKKLNTKKVTLLDLYRVYQTISFIPRIVKDLEETSNKYTKHLIIDPINDLLIDMENFQRMIEKTLDFDVIDRGEYFVKPTFDTELEELYNEKQTVEQKMEKTLKEASRLLNLESGKTIKLECNDLHGYFFRVTLKEERNLRENQHFQVIDVLKGGVRFKNAKLDELNESYTDLKNRYEEQQKSVIKEVFDVASGYADTLRAINLAIAQVDVLVSFANVATNAPITFVKPKLHAEGSGILKLTKIRHPCIELLEGSFVPNDLNFDKHNETLFIISGPNMGGKSTYIRSVGVCVLMAHIGSFVPCATAEISLVDSIFARVGADDNLQKGLSTFMIEMVMTATITKNVTENSLVIIDELGRGTSTLEGSAIAESIAEYLLLEKKCFTLFATHFHRLTQWADKISKAKNYHVTAITTDDNITPLYQIKEGACDKSYGIHCCRIAEFPPDVIKDAKRHQDALEGAEGLLHREEQTLDEKTEAIEEGDRLIKSFLDACTQLKLQNLNPEELIAKVEELKSDLVSKNNPLIKGLLNIS